MIAKYLSEMWTAIAPGLGNHLWQSTLFAVVAGLLTIALRKNHARTRYWLWLAASLKFLIPFSLLVGIGSYIGWSHPSARATDGFYYAMEQAGQPFEVPAISYATPSTGSASLNVMKLLPAVLATAWFCGFVALLFVWCARWRRMSGVLRVAVPLRQGREAETLRRLERVAGIRKKVEIFLSRDSLEPAVFGIFRPALVWPHGISKRLDSEHVEAIIAHELCHLRQRDNLSAALHMLVKAVFWFHPLVWWLGARLAEERELACDEEVLQLGCERELYAESILKVCEFCVGSPLACVSGVTGADLKTRIVRIMTENARRKLDFSKRLLLSAAGFAAIAVPVVSGLAHATPSRGRSQTQGTAAVAAEYIYEVASIKPNKSDNPMVAISATPDGLHITNYTPQMLILMAFGVQDFQLSGGPSWLNSEKYDIEAKMDSSVADALIKLGPQERALARQHMLQALLSDRFGLTVHREIKEIPVFALVIAKNGPKMQEAKPGDTYPNGIKGPDGRGSAGMMEGGRGKLTGQGLPIKTLVYLLSLQHLGRTIVDKTGLVGNYDFKLQWTPESQSAASAQQGADNTLSPDSSGPSIFTAIQEQLGLKLESQKGPVEIFVIDHVERPSEN